MLKFKTSGEELQAAIDKVANAITVIREKKKTLESCILIKIRKDKPFKEGKLAAVVAYDQKKQLVGTFPVYEIQDESDKEEILLYVSGKKLGSMAKVFASSDALLEFTVDTELVVCGGNKNGLSKIKMPLGNTINILEAERNAGLECNLDTDKFIELLEDGGSCFASNTKGKDLDIIMFRFIKKDNKLKVSSSDGIRFAMAEYEGLDLSAMEQDELQCLVGGESLKSIFKILNYKRVSLKIGKAQMCVKCGADLNFFRLKEANYPYELLMGVKEQMKTDAILKVNIDEFMKAIAVMEIGLTNEENYVSISSVSENTVNLSTKSGNAKSQIKVAQKGTFKKVGYSINFLKSTISKMSKEEDIYIYIPNLPEKPSMIKKSMNTENFIILSPNTGEGENNT